MSLRPYQAEAVDAAVQWMRRSAEPFLIEAATGAGKSHMIAAVAKNIHDMSGKRVLCLAPSAELVVQNREKFLATGAPASVFSASAGGKSLRHPVVFGSPLTVRNRISAFKRSGAEGYALVVIDECHGITPTVRGIVEQMREGNPNLRVMGLTATPYRLGSGYIFRVWPDDKVNDDQKAREPYFGKCVYRVDARSLIAGGYLTPPVIGATAAEGYDTGALVADARGRFNADAVDRAYHGHGRKTAAIVADVVRQAQGRRGVLIFAATVRHAEEVLASLPPSLSAIVTGETPAKERARILAEFKSQRIKYLVNVAVLTTGFDAPHVDLIAMMRKTESVGLLQQTIGRGLRTSEGKADCLVLDYTTNIEDHCPDGDLFSPVVLAGGKLPSERDVRATCELCGYENQFTGKKETAHYELDEYGYCLDLEGRRVETEWGPMPGHYGRRCQAMLMAPPRGELVRCGYRWTAKECPACGADNDISARYCATCKAELVDPNEKLRADWQAFKNDPSNRQTDRVVSMVVRDGVSARGNKTLRVDFTTEWRAFSIWLMAEPKTTRAERELYSFQAATKFGARQPRTVTYQKEPSGFYRVFAYDRPADETPEEKTNAA